MAADNPNALSDLPCDLYISDDNGSTFLNVWAVTATVWQIDYSNVTEYNSDNRGTLKSFVDAITNVTANLFENQSVSLLNSIVEWTETLVPGTPVPSVNQTVNSWDWSYNSFIEIDNQNGDKSIITINSVTGSVDWALVANTDYYLGKNEDGKYGIFVIDSATVTTEVQNIVIDHAYTPNASSSFSFTNWTAELKSLYIKLVAVDPTTLKEREFICTSMRYEGTIDLWFVDPVENGSLPSASASFRSNKGSTTTYSTELL